MCSSDLDTQRNRVRATASGATALFDMQAAALCTEEERRLAAAASMRCDSESLEPLALTPALTAYRHDRNLRVVDERGAVRLALRDPISRFVNVAVLEARVREAIEEATNFGDVGRALPGLYVLRAARIAAFEGLSSAEQGASLAAEECDGCAPEERVALLLAPRDA